MYAARTVGRTRGDEVIKKGTTVQTIKQNANRVLDGDKFFTSYRDADKTKYIGYMGKTKTGLKNKIQGTVDKDIRVAGEKNAAKLFRQLKDEDADFRHKFKIWSYDDFNRLELNGETTQMGQKFIEKLKSEGYHGVADMNDRRHNFYHTKAVIMFDNKNLTNIKVSALTKNEYHRNRAKAALLGGADILSTPASIAIAAGVAGSAAHKMFERSKRKTRDAQDDFVWRIQDHLKKHNPEIDIDSIDKMKLIKAYEKGDIDTVFDMIKF